MFEFLDKGYTGSVIGIVGILVGSILSYIFFRKSRIGPRPTYQMAATRVIGNYSALLNKKVEIFFEGNKVERVSKTQIVLWNSGTSTINGSDIVSSDPINFIFSKESRIVDVTIISCARDVNDLKVEINSIETNKVNCTFDFLDPGDGGIIELIHTDSNVYPIVGGTIKGVHKGFVDKGIITLPILPISKLIRKNRKLKITLSVIASLTLILILLQYIFSYLVDKSSLFYLGNSKIFITMALALAGGATTALLKDWGTRRQFPKSLLNFKSPNDIND
jgi:hypothetical protein